MEKHAIITESGRQAIADNYYLNQQGLDNRNLFLQFGGLLVAVLALVVSVFALYYAKVQTQQNTKQSNSNTIVSKGSTGSY